MKITIDGEEYYLIPTVVIDALLNKNEDNKPIDRVVDKTPQVAIISTEKDLSPYDHVKYMSSLRETSMRDRREAMLRDVRAFRDLPEIESDRNVAPEKRLFYGEGVANDF